MKLDIQLSPDNLDLLRSAAATHSMRVRQYVRETALNHAAETVAAPFEVPDPSLERRQQVVDVALAELGKRGTEYDGHGGPEIEHIVRAAKNEYQRYYIVLTAAGKRQLELLDPAITDWGDKVVALVGLEDLGAGPYLAPPEDWCVMFVTWAIGEVYTFGQWWDWTDPMHLLPDHPFGKWFGGVGQTRDWAEAEGIYLGSSATDVAPVGAVFVMPGDSHVGFVVEDLGGGRFRTIEGNLSDEVKSIERSISDCAGFVLWWKALD